MHREDSTLMQKLIRHDAIFSSIIKYISFDVSSVEHFTYSKVWDFTLLTKLESVFFQGPGFQ